MRYYLVTEPIIHDGETYLWGATLELDDGHAAPLLALAAIKAAPPTEADTDAAPAKTSAPTPKTKAGK